MSIPSALRQRPRSDRRPSREEGPRFGLGDLARRLEACRDLASALELLGRLLPALAPVEDRVSLAVIDPADGSLRALRLLPPLEAVPQDLPRVRPEGTVVGEVARDGLPRVVSDLRELPGVAFGRAAHDGIRSTLSVPVRVAGRVVGVLNAGARTPGACRASMLPELAAVADVLGPALLRLVNDAFRTEAPSDPALVGTSAAIVAALELARKAARSLEPVLLTGAPGTGKAGLAKAIHAWSARSAGPLIWWHAPEFESASMAAALFGSQALPGAVAEPGAIARARGGTLVIDEPASLPAPLQAHLVRWLETQLHGADDTQLRLITTSTREIGDLVERGEFRGDLAQRLGVLPISMPSLTARSADLLPIAETVLSRLAPERAARLTERALALLEGHRWTQNVRELEGLLRRALVMESGDRLELGWFAPARQQGLVLDAPDDWPTRDENERRYLRRVLEHTGGVIEGPRGAAKLLGMRASTLRSRLQKLKVPLETGRGRRVQDA